jgi:WD40 repeat protein
VQQITRGTSPAFYPALSPDGKEVAYHAIVNGLRRVFVASSEGGDQSVQVSPGTHDNEVRPSWSPDGKRLVWRGLGQGPVQAVTRSATGWGVPHEVASPGAIVFPTWVDGAQLLAVDTVHGRLVRVNADSAAVPPRVLMEHLEAAAKGMTMILSFDYRTLYLRSRQGLWLLPLSNGAVSDGALREAVRFDDPLHPHASGYRSVAGYGGFLYFTLQNPQSNIWIARVTGLKR